MHYSVSTAGIFPKCRLSVFALVAFMFAAAVSFAVAAPESGLVRSITSREISATVVEVPGVPDGHSSAITMVGIPLDNRVYWSGQVEGVFGRKVDLAQVDWDRETFDDSGDFYLEISQGLLAGSTYSIEAFVAGRFGEILLESSAEGIVASGSLVQIRKYMSFSDLFRPDNGYGFASGDDATTADNVILLDSKSQTKRVLYFSGTEIRWIDTGDPSLDAGDLRIEPGTAVLIRSRTDSPTTLPMIGVERDGVVRSWLYSGINLITKPSADGRFPALAEQRVAGVESRAGIAAGDFEAVRAEVDMVSSELLMVPTKVQELGQVLGISGDEPLRVAGDSAELIVVPSGRATELLVQEVER